MYKITLGMVLIFTISVVVAQERRRVKDNFVIEMPGVYTNNKEERYERHIKRSCIYPLLASIPTFCIAAFCFYDSAEQDDNVQLPGCLSARSESVQSAESALGVICVAAGVSLCWDGIKKCCPNIPDIK